MKNTRLNFNQIVQFYPKLLQTKITSFLQNLDDPFYRGNLSGHLYEHYILNLICTLAIQSPEIDWVIVPHEKKKYPKEKNGLIYSPEGAIILNRKNYAIAEYDCIFSYKGHIILCEIKTSKKGNLDVNNFIIAKSRFEFLLGSPVIYFIIRDTINIPEKLKNWIDDNPMNYFILIPKDDEFNEHVKKKYKTIPLIEIDSDKFPDLHSKFPQIIDYFFESSLVRDFLNFSMSKIEFFQRYERFFNTYVRIPIGCLGTSFEFNKLPEFDFSSIFPYHSWQNIIIVYLIWSPEKTLKFTLEFVLINKIHSKRIQTFRKGTFNLDMNGLKNFSSKISSKSFFFHQAKKFAKNSDIRIITEPQLKRIINRCKELSN